MATKASTKKSIKQPRIKKVLSPSNSKHMPKKEWVTWIWHYAKEPSAKQLVKDKIFIIERALKKLYDSENKTGLNHKSTFVWSKNGLVLTLKVSLNTTKITDGGAATTSTDPPPPKQPPPPPM